MKRFFSTDIQLMMVILVILVVMILSSLLSVWLTLLIGVVLLGLVWFFKDYLKSFFVPSSDEQSLKQLLTHMPVGIVRFDQETQAILWFNPYIELLFADENGKLNEQLIRSLIRERQHQTTNHSVMINNNRYAVSLDEKGGYFYCLDRNLSQLDQQVTRFSQPVIGVISLDNYDDMSDSLSDAEISQINSFVAKFIAKFAEEYHIFYRRVDMDRFYFFTDYDCLTKLIESEFSLLDQFRKEAQELNLPLTLSIGIAHGENHHQLGVIAQENLNIALVRGGDQVVLKGEGPHKKLRYFGGGSIAAVKRSRTRTRAMMTAISDKIRDADKVFVVGHRNLDMDALGSMVGMAAFSANIIDKSYAVYDPVGLNSDIVRALKRLDEEERTSLMPLDKAMKAVTEDSLLIMVDHSKVQLTMSKEFYQKFSEVIVIDHHRRDDDFPNNAVLTFIESGASSASELVSELLQFQNAKRKPTRIQASVMMAGIMLDTQQFSSRVTSRTFDVASYLRGLGSDSVEIQQISATDFDEYRLVNQLILTGQRHDEQMMIACGDDETVYTNTIASKAADTLLSMADTEASFVIVRNTRDQIAISARSRSRVNVQRIMENLGGGGHFNLAACQMEGMTIVEARAALLEQIAMVNK